MLVGVGHSAEIGVDHQDGFQQDATHNMMANMPSVQNERNKQFFDAGQVPDRSVVPCFMMHQHHKLVGATVVDHLGHSNLPPLLVPFDSRFLDRRLRI
jgi:hypothetical protein